MKFAINSSISTSITKAPFELIYEYLPQSFPSIVFDSDNPASMNFLEHRMLSQLAVQDAIIAAKTEQSYHVNKRPKKDPDIKIDDLVAVSNKSQLSHLPKRRQKLAIKRVDSYKITKVDKAIFNYTLDIQDSKRHSIFHINNIKRSHLELFLNHKKRQPRITSAEQDFESRRRENYKSRTSSK